MGGKLHVWIWSYLKIDGMLFLWNFIFFFSEFLPGAITIKIHARPRKLCSTSSGIS
jgi:hypothetical protein